MAQKIISVIILTFVLIGCSNHIQSPQVTNKNDIINIPSTINIKVNNRSVDVPFTSYVTLKHFKNGITSESTHDPAIKKPSSKNNVSFVLPPNTKITVDKNIMRLPKISVNYFDKQSNKQIDIKLSNSSFELPSKQGQYEYRINATWHNCRAFYTFLAKVK